MASVVSYFELGLMILAASAAVLAAVWARSAAENGREARRLMEALAEAMRKGHGYPDPSAVATPAPASGPREAEGAQLPEPVHARAAAGALLTPFRPSPGQVEAARTEHAKATARQRWEAAEDARDQEREQAARKAALNAAALRAAAAGNVTTEGDRPAVEIAPPPVALPSALPLADHGDSDAGTQVFHASDRPTMLGGAAPRKPYAAEPTLISAGIIPRPGAVPMTDPIEARFLALCETARRAGLAVDHCNDHRADCDYADDTIGACLCACDGCTRAASYAAQAEREIMGPPLAETPRAGRE